MATLSLRPAEPAGAGQEAVHQFQAVEAQIEGRYRRITVHQLTLAWWLHTAGHLTRRQLRVYFAAHEMHERRNYTDRVHGPERPLYRIEELAALVGGRGSQTAYDELRADVKRLAAVGLVKIAKHGIEFAQSADQITVEDLAGFWSMFEQMPNRRRTVPVPRRTLRALAAGFSRAVTGVMLAMLIRSLFWHRESGTYRVDGRTKGSWIAEVFGISRRAVTEARATLIELGWIEPMDAPQWALNRWGSHDRINAAWSASEDRGATDSTPGAVGEGGSPPVENASPCGRFSAVSATPCLNRFSSLTRDKNTRRLDGTAPDPAGASARSRWGGRKKEQAAGAPNIRDIQPRHLKRTEDLLELYRQAVEIGLAKPSEAGRLDFLALAERAKAHGKRTGALFYWLLREKKTVFITQADEDAACVRLRELRDGPRRREQWGGESHPPAPKPLELTDDERFMLACVRVAAQRRIDDPFHLARGRGWTREQWERVESAYRARQIAHQQAGLSSQDSRSVDESDD